ncbi:MAG: imidazole glycerol phosphate synthase subunit HisH [Solirubrobacteraceae bacterium]
MSVSPVVAVVDYGMGNRRSVQKALEHVGARAQITRDHAALRDADAVVVPGVGAFPHGMRNLVELGLDEQIRGAAQAGKPVLGICLGMQLLFSRSREHALTEGLGLIGGEVSPIDAGGLRVPHIGWNEVTFVRGSPLTAALPASGCPFYHVHSLAAHPDDPDDVVATTTYGERFATVVARDNVYGVQFHPEKSSADGLTLLGAFVVMAAGGDGGLDGTPARAWGGSAITT